MSETKNLIIASVISLVVLLLWQYFYVAPHTQQQLAAQNAAEQQKAAAAPTAPSAPEAIATPDTLKPREEVLAVNKAAPRVRIDTPHLRGSINLRGGRMDDLTLVGYAQELHGDKDVALLSPSGAEDMYVAEFGWLASDASVTTPNGNTVWTSKGGTLTPKTPVVLSWDNGKGITFTRTISVDENYMFTIEDKVTNGSKAAVALSPYSAISRLHPDSKAIYISHEGAVGVAQGVLEEMTYKKLKEASNTSFDDAKGWLGFADKYWLTAMVPPHDATGTMRMQFSEKVPTQLRYQVDYTGKSVSIAAGESTSYTQNFFAGAKKVTLIDSYKDQLDIPLFDRAVDFGALYFITRMMFTALHFFHGWVGNFGIAILMLTVLVKAILFPLSYKSYTSMAKMRMFMPDIERIREQHKNDKMAMNTAMMKLYTEKKINPMSGCFPILMQIPIFFSLYKMIYISIEMRHAPFYGWIHDLSAPDPTNIFNAFGLLHYDVPGWLPVIGLLPILFAASMYLQQALNPPASDPTQAMVMKWLPVIFLIMFANFPAGLVIYWTWSNLLSCLQQFLILRHVEHTKGKV